MDIFEIGSNCPIELINPRKTVRDPNDFYDGIMRRQVELLQKHFEELKRKERPGTFTAHKQPEITREDSTKKSFWISLVMRENKKNRWDSVVKENPEQSKELYKGPKADVKDFLYL